MSRVQGKHAIPKTMSRVCHVGAGMVTREGALGKSAVGWSLRKAVSELPRGASRIGW